MAKQVIRWRCKFLSCSFDKNWEYVDDVKKGSPLICKNCGIGTEPLKPVATSGSWLPCIPLTGLNLRIPNGTPGGIDWVDGASNKFSLEEYIKVHNVNPEIFYYFSHPKLKRPADLVPQPIPQELENAASVDEPLSKADQEILKAQKKVDENRDSGKIKEIDYIKKTRYLEKLRDWRNKDLITDEDLKEQIDKALQANN
jgi:hypothetical protein